MFSWNIFLQTQKKLIFIYKFYYFLKLREKTPNYLYYINYQISNLIKLLLLTINVSFTKILFIYENNFSSVLQS